MSSGETASVRTPPTAPTPAGYAAFPPPRRMLAAALKTQNGTAPRNNTSEYRTAASRDGPSAAEDRVDRTAEDEHGRRRRRAEHGGDAERRSGDPGCIVRPPGPEGTRHRGGDAAAVRSGRQRGHQHHQRKAERDPGQSRQAPRRPTNAASPAETSPWKAISADRRRGQPEERRQDRPLQQSVNPRRRGRGASLDATAEARPALDRISVEIHRKTCIRFRSVPSSRRGHAVSTASVCPEGQSPPGMTPFIDRDITIVIYKAEQASVLSFISGCTFFSVGCSRSACFFRHSVT